MQEALFSGFRRGTVVCREADEEIAIPYVTGGSGPPLLLLHGFPQTHAMWHKVAGPLARRHTVVATDLRGYGQAGKPASRGGARYAKRAMAADQLAVMRALGHARFAVMGHDRGARVAHRLALDHPQAVSRLVLLDIAPTLAMYEQTDMRFASTYWHWFFLIQPEPLPETLVGADPEFMLRRFMGTRHAGMDAFDPRAWDEYVRHAREPAAIHAMCEDYRAAAGIDLEHDRADRSAGRRLAMPVAVLWGEHGGLARCFDPLALWRDYAADLCGEALPCGHYLAEEMPEALVDACRRYLE
ncbi:alpha/beta hydrolase [Orrella sp. JC864]|uniref:alpha/beta fold hydrolase n=1 Tax=Orrella sp. JC864 TaxID=3120298 RepID=UPI00300A15EF